MFISERLADDHVLAKFDCGNDHLNDWLQDAALQQQAAAYSSTFVWCDGTLEVLGYFAISSQSVVADSLPKKVVGKNLAAVPAALIGKLALDRSLQRQEEEFGGHLLVDAERRICRAGAEGPAVRVVLVDAIDERAFRFYKKYGYNPVAPDSMRLYRKISAIRADLDL